MKKTVIALCVLSLLASAGAIAPRQDQQRRKTPEFEKEIQINLVLLDVLVLDRNGTYVNGLSKDDFIILEDGKPVDVSTVDEYYTPVSEAEAAAQGQVFDSPPRNVIFVLDRLFSSTQAVKNGKEIIIKFIQEKLQPGDRAMILTYDHGFRTVQDISSDLRRLEMAAEGIDATSVSLETPEMLINVASDSDQAMRLDTQNLDNRNQTSQFIDMSRNMRLQTEIRNFLDHMQLLAKSFKALPGRKTVILLSEGYDDRLVRSSTLVRQKSIGERLEEEANQTSLSTSATYNQNSSVQLNFHNMVTRVNDASTSFYVVDIGTGTQGVRTDQPDQQSLMQRADFKSARLDSLAALADSSGGKLYAGWTDYGSVMEWINRDISNFYIISYNTPNVSSDGNFRNVEVRTKNDAYTVRSRKGYFEAKRYDRLDQNEKFVHLMEGFFRANPASEMEAASSMFFLPLYTDTVVGTLSVAIPAKELGAGSGEKSLEAIGTIMDSAGRTIDAFHRSFPYGKVLDQVKADGEFSLKLPFLLTSGNNRVKVILRDNASGNRHYIFDEYVTRGAEPEDLFMSSVLLLDEQLSLCSVDKYKINPVEKGGDSGLQGRNTPDPLKASTGKPIFPHLNTSFGQKDSPIVFFSAGNYWQDPKSQQVDFYIDYALIDANGKEHMIAVGKERLIPVPGVRRVNVLSELQLSGVDPGTYQLRVRFLDQKKLQGVQRMLPLTVN